MGSIKLTKIVIQQYSFTNNFRISLKGQFSIRIYTLEMGSKLKTDKKYLFNNGAVAVLLVRSLNTVNFVFSKTDHFPPFPK